MKRRGAALQGEEEGFEWGVGLAAGGALAGGQARTDGAPDAPPAVAEAARGAPEEDPEAAEDTARDAAPVGADGALGLEAEAAGEDAGGGDGELDLDGGGGGLDAIDPVDGPMGDGLLDGALSAAFGSSLSGTEAHFGESRRNADLGADAHAEGGRMSFGAGIRPGRPDALGPKVLNTLAHEMAHALSTHGGPEHDGVDLEGDRGEAAADRAGDGFEQWARAGFEGPAPSLRPAQGGGAQLQRHARRGNRGFTGTPALRRGARGGRVSTLQTLLRRHGHRVAVDGDFGPATEAAVRRFQQSKRLVADGVVGPKTARKLRARRSGGGASAVSLSRWLPLRQGARNTGVSRLQRLLNRRGARLSTDGVFGPATLRAVRGFQRSNGLSVDGVVGPRTARTLNSRSARDIGSWGGGGGMPGRYLGRYAAYRYGRYQGMIRVVQMDGKKVALKTARAWKRLKAAARRDGVYLRLNSGFRTMAEQRYLYSLFLSGRGNLAAPPGYSNHQHGQALDISVVNPVHYRWMHRNAPRYGFRRTVPSEPWHWEYFGS